MSDVKFTKRSYYNVAQEHLVLAIELHRSHQYFASHYFAGVAIESILRAYCNEGGDSFDRSHSLDYWASKEKLLPQGEEKQMAFRALLVEANLRWRANQRYMTPKMLDSHLHSINIDKIRGDRVKYSANRLLELAGAIVGLGVEKWKK